MEAAVSAAAMNGRAYRGLQNSFAWDQGGYALWAFERLVVVVVVPRCSR